MLDVTYITVISLCSYVNMLLIDIAVTKVNFYEIFDDG